MRHSRVLPIALVAFALGCAEGRTADEPPDAVTADPDHYTVEFENDVARVLRIAYGANERSVMHHHPANCFVALSAASVQMTDVEGEATEMTLSLGQVGCGDAEDHLPENLLGEPNELILIEFKEGATAQHAMSNEHPDAVTADPDHYSVEFENDVVRLLRIAYGSGERSVMHYHPANCAVPLSAGSWQMTDPEGAAIEDSMSLGEVECVDAGAHLPENKGDAAELILIEFKGREVLGGESTAS